MFVRRKYRKIFRVWLAQSVGRTVKRQTDR
jgi:hypothetical protein